MKDQILIYAAGNEDMYPVEYYHKGEEEFCGVIPELVEDFSDMYDGKYKIEYLNRESSGSRKQMVENGQVDMTFVRSDDLKDFSNLEKVRLFALQGDEGSEIYYAAFTDSAPDSFVEDFTDYAESVTQEEISGLIAEQAGEGPAYDGMLTTLFALAAVALTAVAVIVSVIIKKYRREVKKLSELAAADPVSGLDNRESFIKKWNRGVTDRNRILYYLVYIYIDVESLKDKAGIKEINDFIKYCGTVIKEFTKSRDIAARADDNGFVMLKMAGNEEILMDEIVPLMKRLESYREIYNLPYEYPVSAGIYHLNSEVKEKDIVILDAYHCADSVMGRENNICIVSEELLKKFHNERLIQIEIEEGLEKKQFQLYIQYYVDAENGKVLGGEALSRWIHPSRGLVMPGEYVPFLEKNGDIRKYDYYILEEVCLYLQKLAGEGIADFFISCNFSRDTFASADFAENCREIISRYDFDRQLLILEITESVSEKDRELMKKNISEVKKEGVKVVLDDFGAGVTSLLDLQNYRIDGIKVDKRLVDELSNRTGCEIMRAVVFIGHRLGLTILAEGVETEEQAKVLRKMQCDVLQGYCFYRPVPSWEADVLIRERFRKK